MSDDVLAKLKSVSIPTISQILRRRGVGNAFLSGVAPRTPLQSLVGRAFTARALPTRQDVAATQAGAASLHRRAFETIRPGYQVVYDQLGSDNIFAVFARKPNVPYKYQQIEEKKMELIILVVLLKDY